MKKVFCLLLSLLVCLASGAVAQVDMPLQPVRAVGVSIEPAAKVIREALAIANDAEVYFALPGALEDWLIDHANLTETGFTFGLPSFADAKRGQVPVYQGEQPSEFLPAYVQALGDRFALLAQGEEIATEEGTAVSELAAALQAVLGGANEWLNTVMNDTKGYSALSRYLLHYEGDATVWKGIPFTKAAQAPLFGTAGERKTINASSSGAQVREVQTRLVELGLLPEDSVNGSFGKPSQEAALKFEKANGLPEDGVLDATDQRVLFGEPLPQTLPQALYAELDEDMTDFRPWWNTCLRMITRVEWTGSSLVIEHNLENMDTDVLEDEVLAVYNTGTLPISGMHDKIMELSPTALYAWDDVAVDPTIYEAQLDLQAIAEGRMDELLLYDGASDLYDLFKTLAWDLIYSEEYLVEYAQENPAPVAWPQNGGTIRPPSGSAKIALKNGFDVPVYYRIYAVEDEYDISTDNLVGACFVHPGKTGTLSLRPGYYHMHYGSGETWYGEELMFGDDGRYQCCDGSDYIGSNRILTYYLNVEYNDGDSFGTDYVSPDDF